MAVLGLRFDLLSRGARDAERDLDRLGNASDRTGSRVGGLGKALAAGLGGAALGGLAAFTAGLKGGLEEAISYEKITDQLAQTLKSTGNAAGTSIGELKAYAGQLESLSGVDEELILSSQNVLATFTKIGNKVGEGNNIFDQASLAALNLSTTLGTSVVGAATQVGKALNDPLKGITALGKAGVSFTVEQKALIKSLVESGDTLGAQKVILKELEVQYGGAAKAAGEGLGGSLARLQDSVSDSFRTIATAALPTLASLSESLAAKLPGAIATVSGAFATIGSAIKGAAGFLNDNKSAVIALATAYTVTLIPALVRASAFAAGQLLASLAAAATGAQALALRLGAAALAAAPLLALGAVVGGVGFAILKGREEAERFSAALKEAGETKVADPGFAATREQLVQTIAKLEEFGKAPARLREARDALNALDASVTTSNTNVGALAKSFGITSEQLLVLANAAKIDLGSATFEDAKNKIDAYRATSALATSAAGKLAVAQKTLGNETATAEDKVKALNDTFNVFYGVALTAQEGNDRYKASLIAATAALQENGRTLNGNTTAGLANREAIRNVIAASQAKADADFAATDSQDRYNRILRQGRDDAVRLATATGGSADEINNFRRELKLVPGSTPAALNVKINPSDAQNRLETLRSLYQGFTDKTFTVQQIILSDDRRDAARAAGPRQRANGGAINKNQPYLVGERGPEIIYPSKSGFVATAKQSAPLLAGGDRTDEVIEVLQGILGAVQDGPRRTQQLLRAN